MRSISTSAITYSSAAEVNGSATATRVVEAAAPDIMQAKVAAIIAEFATAANANWLLTHIDVAGGGDGHTFVTTLEFANTTATPPLTVPPVGLELENDGVAIFFYMASQAEALVTARAGAQAQIAALFAAPTNADTVQLWQTAEGGASKGTRFMGALVTQITLSPQ